MGEYRRCLYSWAVVRRRAERRRTHRGVSFGTNVVRGRTDGVRYVRPVYKLDEQGCFKVIDRDASGVILRHVVVGGKRVSCLFLGQTSSRLTYPPSTLARALTNHVISCNILSVLSSPPVVAGTSGKGQDTPATHCDVVGVSL